MVRLGKRFSVLLAVVLLLETVTASNLKWVPASEGSVPEYAVVGGENFSGEVLYVARIKLTSGETPGKMAPSFKIAHAGYGGREIYKSDYEILTNPGWRSHLEWKESSGRVPPANAVVGGHDKGRSLYVARFMYVDGHMIPGKAFYPYQKAYVSYNMKEFESKEWYVLVEHPSWYVKRGLFKRSKFSEIPVPKNLKRAPIKRTTSECCTDE